MNNLKTELIESEEPSINVEELKDFLTNMSSVDEMKSKLLDLCIFLGINIGEKTEMNMNELKEQFETIEELKLLLDSMC